jgi:hypothetical protein
MIDKPDPAKDAGRTDAPGAKRPHATLDIKATEVKPATPAAAQSASTSAASSTPGGSPTGTSSAGGSSASGAASAKASGTADASAKASAPNAGPKATSPAKPEPKPAGSGSGSGFFSHLAAGVIGGAVVYAAAAFLGPNWLPGVRTDDTSGLAARISALESAPREGADLSALDARIGGVEERAAKIDEIERNLAALRDAQGALEAETKSIGTAVQQGDGEANAERLAKLEQQLSMIASGSSGASGNVQQLAAISGKISDIESSLADLRKTIPAEVDQKLAAAAAASEAAKSAALRLDRELSQVRTEQARGTQKAEAAKADADRIAATVDAAKEEVARLASAVGELRSSVDSQLKAFAKPADVSAAVGPVNSKLAELEQNVQTIVSNEQSRKQNAERIVLALELSNLKRALDRGQGQGYAAELEEVRKASAGQLDLAPLERFKDRGVATPAELKAEFRPLINAVIDADLEPADGSVIDRLLAGAKSVVRVRKVSHEADDTSTEAIVARMEAALNDGRLGDVLAQAKTLPQRARVPIEDWLIKVTARDTVEQAIAAVEAKLKASLSGAPEPAAPAPVQN